MVPVIKATLSLPRSEAFLVVAREFVTSTLLSAGLDKSFITDVRLAVGEACANVVQHAQPSPDYEVSIELDESTCAISIADQGDGFDPTSLPQQMPTALEGHGRGVLLMKAIADDVVIDSKPQIGTTVHLRLAVRLETDSLLVGSGVPR